MVSRSLIKSKLVPGLVDTEEDEEEESHITDPLPEKLQNSMVINNTLYMNMYKQWSTTQWDAQSDLVSV